MSETKNAHDGVVTSIADTDLVMVVGPQGGLHPVSFANLMKAVRGGIQIGGRNLLLNEFTFPGGGASVVNGKIVMSQNKDNYFAIKLSPSADLKVGEIYTISFDCDGMKAGNSWLMEGVSSASTFRISLQNGRNKATFVMNQSQIDRIPGAFMFDDDTRSFPAGFSAVTLSNFKLERGNIATDCTPAPEDIASGLWGG